MVSASKYGRSIAGDVESPSLLLLLLLLLSLPSDGEAICLSYSRAVGRRPYVQLDV